MNRIPDALFVFLGFGLLRWRSRFAVEYGDVRVSPVEALITDSLKSCVELLLVSWYLAGIWLLIRRQNGDETLMRSEVIRCQFDSSVLFLSVNK